MSIFQKRELSTCGGTEPTPPRAAVCFTTSAMTRRAADWLARLGGCRPLGILSDHGEDVIWQCEAENVDLLLLETDFSPAAEDTKDVSARCDIAIEVRRRLPECKVYLACEDGCPEKLPALDKAPLVRENRLYQADWLLRFYGFRANELLDDNAPDFDPALDPKCCWALRHPEFFPVEVNRADYEALLRVPGIGVVSAKRILVARRSGALRAEDLKKLGVVMKRAQYFLTCGGRYASPLKLSQEGILQNLMAVERRALPQAEAQQLSLFDQVG